LNTTLTQLIGVSRRHIVSIRPLLKIDLTRSYRLTLDEHGTIIDHEWLPQGTLDGVHIDIGMLLGKSIGSFKPQPLSNSTFKHVSAQSGSPSVSFGP
jgi:hypothetical protein